MTQRGPVPAGDIPSNAYLDPSAIWPSGYVSTSDGNTGFASANSELGALVDNLLAHGEQGLNTLKGIASTWAPAGGNRDPADYATNLALRTGLKPTQPLDMADPDTLTKVAKAVIWNQIGRNPFGASQINQAVQERLAQHQALRAQPVQAVESGPAPAPAPALRPAPVGDWPISTSNPASGVPAPAAMAPYIAAGPAAERERGLPTGSVAGLLAGNTTTPGAVSSAGTVTPLQVLPSTARSMNMDPRFLATHPDAATQAGAAYLSQLYGTFGNLPDAYAAYNAGPSAAQEWIGAGRPSTGKGAGVASYVQRAMAAQQAAAGQGGGDWANVIPMTLTAAERGAGALLATPGDLARALSRTGPQAASIYARLGPGARNRATATDNMPIAALARKLPTSDEMTSDIVKAVGNSPYDATSAGGRIFQSGVSGAVSAGPFGLPGAIYGALSGAVSQGAQELGLPPWVQGAVGLGAPLLAGRVGAMAKQAGSLVSPSLENTLEDFWADESGGSRGGPKVPKGTGSGTAAAGPVDPDSVRLQPYGVGAGHHILAKRAFEGVEGYDLKQALAISNDELGRLNVIHTNITPKQQQLYMAFAKTGKPLTLEAMQSIETKALIQAGMDAKIADSIVKRAVAHMKDSGISAPIRTPWG